MAEEAADQFRFKPLLAAEKVTEPSFAWARYEPGADRPWDLRLAGHLYRRAGFAGNWDQLQTALKDGPQATVDKLLRSGAETTDFNRVQDNYEKAAAQSSGDIGPQAWWLRRMCETPSPLLEQMTLFWHNYFGVSDAHVNNPSLVCRHIQALRQHALGKFDVLLESVLSQPAVLMCVDARASRKARPNENLARVLLEEYTLGPNGFAEADLRATAEALTGWFVSQNELHYSPREHSAGRQTLLGETGDFSKPDLVRLLSHRTATARRVTRALYRWFISEKQEQEQEEEALLAPLATQFAQDSDIGMLVRTMLGSNLFFSARAYRQRIKSPVEFALGIARSFGGVIPTTRLAADLADLGQDLYNPPTIRGWAGNRNWINRFTMLGRMKLAHSLLESAGAYGNKLDPVKIAAGHDCDTFEAGSRFLFELLLQGDLPGTFSDALPAMKKGKEPLAGAEPARDFCDLAAQIAALPEFNLA